MSAVVLEERPVSNENEWKLEEHLVVVRRWELQEAPKIRKVGSGRGSTSQSEDMGRTSKQTVPLIKSILEQVMSVSIADWVSCTNMDWLHRSHMAEKRRQYGESHGRPHSSR